MVHIVSKNHQTDASHVLLPWHLTSLIYSNIWLTNNDIHSAAILKEVSSVFWEPFNPMSDGFDILIITASLHLWNNVKP